MLKILNSMLEVQLEVVKNVSVIADTKLNEFIGARDSQNFCLSF